MRNKLKHCSMGFLIKATYLKNDLLKEISEKKIAFIYYI